MRRFLFFVMSCAAAACGGRSVPVGSVRPVKVETAVRAGFIDRDFAGLATPDDAVNLAFKLSGQVLDIPVSQGEAVDAAHAAAVAARGRLAAGGRSGADALCAGPLVV